ncbi:integral membrane protein (Pth11), putative [Talaromyces marneffei ATCC 18224]|uniref:Integral membrane protein (Pth11), putative n=1 Tax=Talaromyces marneffei (strain ATCC 18224 / CBS 334.59 / QM 7333) TaxID=441960 RepID=B6QW85_TALMQ|nr:integral membrane protein (Pth11), putative [Talaromyces marneffei ATCC 18224]
MSSTEIVGAMPPPEGVTPDFSLTMTTVQHKFIVVYSITFGIAVLLLLLRLYTRAFIVFSAAFFALCVVSMKYGFGRHLWNVPATAMATYLKASHYHNTPFVLLIPIVITYCWAPFMTKFSILLMYLRLNPAQYFRYTIYVLMFIITGYTLATTLATAGGCNPTNTDKTPCINDLAMWQAILNIVTDFLMLLLPVPLVWRLQAPLTQKLGLTLIFAIGSAVVITSIIRITFIMEILHKADFTWAEATVCVWSAIELNFGIMCNCLVVLKPFARTFFPLLIPSSKGYSGGQSDGVNLKSGSRRKQRSGSHPLDSLDDISHPSQGGHRAKHSNDDGAIVVTNTLSGRYEECEWE